MIDPFVRALVLVALVGVTAACDTVSETEATAAATAPAEGTPVPQPSPGAAEAAHPMPSPSAVGEAPGAIVGTVGEAFDSAGYTYVRVDAEAGPTWAAVQQMSVSVGDRITVSPGSVMRGFHSRTLDRTFDAIVFSPGARVLAPGEEPPSAAPAPAGPAHATPPPNLPPGHPPI